MSEPWGFADIYDLDARRSDAAGPIEDVQGSEWRNILVFGRATAAGVFPETLALVGRARYMADELGCRVEVLLVGSALDAATETLKRYAIDTIYRVQAPDYAPIDHTAKVLEQVVRKRRPELVLLFQSRTGDAVTGFAASRLGVGFVTGATSVEVDTNMRRARVVHQAGNEAFQIVSEMAHVPQFVTVQRGLFRAPLEDPYARVAVHDLELDAGRTADIRVLEREPPAPRDLETAERVLVAGARVSSPEEVEAARRLAERLGAAFGVTIGIVERGLAKTDAVVGERDRRIRPRLLFTVGVKGSLDFLQAIDGEPTIVSIGCQDGDPIAERADYCVIGPVTESVAGVLDAL